MNTFASMHISDDAARSAIVQTIKEAHAVSQAKMQLAEIEVLCRIEMENTRARLAGALNGPQPRRAETELKNLEKQHARRLAEAREEYNRLEEIRLTAYQESAVKAEEFFRAQEQDAKQRAKKAKRARKVTAA